MPNELAGYEQDVFDMIVEFTKDYGMAPTVREMSDDLGIPVKTIHAVVGRLDSKGWIGKHPGVNRGIYIRLGKTCPCCGQAVKN
jgi:SOS-response transcriptional repressor LexA